MHTCSLFKEQVSGEDLNKTSSLENCFSQTKFEGKNFAKKDDNEKSGEKIKKG